MAFGNLGQSNRNSPVAEINMIPMIDVMLVLLVIFIVTAPLVSQQIQLKLPQTVETKTHDTDINKPLSVSINAESEIFIDNEKVEYDSLASHLNELQSSFKASLSSSPVNSTKPQPVHLYIDASVPYEKVAKLLAQLSASGFSQIGFASTPEKKEDQ